VNSKKYRFLMLLFVETSQRFFTAVEKRFQVTFSSISIVMSTINIVMSSSPNNFKYKDVWFIPQLLYLVRILLPYKLSYWIP